MLPVVGAQVLQIDIYAHSVEHARGHLGDAHGAVFSRIAYETQGEVHPSTWLSDLVRFSEKALDAAPDVVDETFRVRIVAHALHVHNVSAKTPGEGSLCVSETAGIHYLG